MMFTETATHIRTQQEEEMAMTGKGTSSAIVPKEEQAGVDMIPHGGNFVQLLTDYCCERWVGLT